MTRLAKRAKQDQEEAEWPEETWEEEIPVAKPRKKAKVQAEASDEWQGDEAWAEELPVKKKKSKVSKVPKHSPAKPEELEPGTVVLYWDVYRGVVRDAFGPLNEFWITEEESGEIVRDENTGDVYTFKSEELQLVAGVPVIGPMPKGEGRGPAGGVLLIGCESHMLMMLNHFGSPSDTDRQEPQMLLAIPCNMCDPDQLLSVASQGVDPKIKDLAQRQREDIHVAVRAFHLKQAAMQLGKDLLRMESFFVLSSINVPYDWEAIEKHTGWDRKWREEACNQIDVGVTSLGFYQIGDVTVTDTARRTLGQTLGVNISFPLWDEQVQATLRRQLDVELPLEVVDANGMRISVLILPNDAVVSRQDGILSINEAPDADYLAAEADNGAGGGDEEDAEDEPEEAEEEEPQVQGKTVAQWEAEQSQLFGDQPKLPPGWIRIKSRSSGEVYFWNKRSNKAQFDFPEEPLPNGWTKQKSKSTGKTYYFHAAKRLSQFERPKA